MILVSGLAREPPTWIAADSAFPVFHPMKELLYVAILTGLVLATGICVSTAYAQTAQDLQEKPKGPEKGRANR